MRKIFVFLTLLFSVYVSAFSQITVTSLVELDSNLDATTNYPKKDLNGKTCAIIKIFTTVKGFTFDAGQLGIVAAEYKPAEVWIYVPGGTRKLKIVHEQLGHISNADVDGFYWFPEGGVKSGQCYKMELSTGTLPVNEEPKVRTGWLLFNTTPLGADVYLSQDGIQESYLGITPLSKKLSYGTYSYRVKKNQYNDEVGLVEIKDESQKMAITLKPVIDSIYINTPVINNIEVQPKTRANKPTVEVLQSQQDTSVIIRKEEKQNLVIKPETPAVAVNKNKDPFFRFGLEGNFEIASMNSFSKTAFGIGTIVRLGRMSSLINVNLGLKYQNSSVSKDLYYDFLDYESYNTFKGSAKYKNAVNEVMIPAILNFNFKKAYVGVGCEFGLSLGSKESYTPNGNDGFDYEVYKAYSEYKGEDITPVSFPSSALVLQAGYLHRHYDVKLYYKYDLANSSMSPMTFGVGVGYYF